MGKTKLTPQQRKAVAASVLEEGVLPTALPSTSGMYRPAPAAPPPATHVHQQYDIPFTIITISRHVFLLIGVCVFSRRVRVRSHIVFFVGATDPTPAPVPSAAAKHSTPFDRNNQNNVKSFAPTQQYGKIQ
jgi:hypothetical protein